VGELGGELLNGLWLCKMVALTKTVGHKRGRPNEEGGRGTRINAVLINSKAYNREKTMRGRVGMRNLRALIEVRRGARHVSTKAYFQTAEGVTCSDYCWASLEAAAEKKTIRARQTGESESESSRGKVGTTERREQRAKRGSVQFTHSDEWCGSLEAAAKKQAKRENEVPCKSRAPTSGVAVWRRQRRSKPFQGVGNIR
jgi:hypothetical protein